MPSPLPTDSNDVQVALTTAQSLWGQDPREALRWLRKAAEGASDAGDDMRSVQLARAAADLRNQAGVTASLNPPPDAAPSVPAAAPVPQEALTSALGQNPAQTVPATPAAAAAAALQQASAAAQAMQSQPSAEQQAAAQVYAAQQEAIAQQAAQANQQAAAQAAQQALQQAAAAAQAQTAAQLAQTARHPAVTTQRLTQPTPSQPIVAAPPSAPVVAPAPSAPIASAPPAPVAAAFGNSGLASSTPVAFAPPVMVSPASNGAVAVSTTLESAPYSAAPPSAPYFVTHRSVRVALSPSPNGEGEFSVHPLAEGEAVPPGWKDALLVALDPAERLFPGRG